jgi:RNA polymerase primary sigma factor
MDIKVLDDVPGDGTEGELKAEVKEEPDEAAPATDSIGESSDYVCLYLKEMGNFRLLLREQEVEIAKRIEAGENEVEDEVLRSSVTLDLVIEMGARVDAGEAALRELFEENEEPADTDEERGPNEKQLKQLSTAITKLKSLHRRIEDLEEKLKERPKPILKARLEKSQMRLKESVKRELHALELSRHLQEAVIGEMRRLLQEARHSQTLIQRYEEATGRSKSRSFCAKRPRPKTAAMC